MNPATVQFSSGADEIFITAIAVSDQVTQFEVESYDCSDFTVILQNLEYLTGICSAARTLAVYSCHNSFNVTPTRRSSEWISR